MKTRIWLPPLVWGGLFMGVAGPGFGAEAERLGVFEGHGDVGAVARAGSAEHDASTRTYTISGGGENMWFGADAFHFVWKKVTGDVSLTADVSFVGAGGNPHRKAVLMIRQSLDPESAYADVALHGDGLTSLQFRDGSGVRTREVQANSPAPRRLRLEKRGATVTLWLAKGGEEPTFAGASTRVSFDEPFYVGLGVCAHDKDKVETAVFSDVGLAALGPPASTAPVLWSALETVAVASTDRRVVHVAPGRIEAPNWTRDGAALLFNAEGRIHRMAAGGGTPQAIDTGFADRCNNDHGLSPDGTLLAISDESQGEHQSVIYVLPAGGGTPRRVTARSPSYWHGWSPDGQTLAYCAERNREFDVYTIPVAGGEETRLTTTAGLDDGPEYSPDGRFIYWNSDRTGTMQIWRMRPDGSGQEQVTFDDFNNWFPHLSPDGRRMVFLSYDKSVSGHPANKDVSLRLMSLEGDRPVTLLATLFGGQGTINVPSWSPDGSRLAFVSYHLLP